MIDALPTARAYVCRKIVQVASVGLDGVHRRIALAQRLEKLVDRLLDGSATGFCSHRCNQSHHRDTENNPAFSVSL